MKGGFTLPVTMGYASRFVGNNVIAYHVNGMAYHGTLHSVNNRGIYLMNARGLRPASADNSTPTIEHAISDGNNDISEAFFPFFFLGFAALAGLAAASAWYPYGYGYGYGYGYPGYLW